MITSVIDTIEMIWHVLPILCTTYRCSYVCGTLIGSTHKFILKNILNLAWLYLILFQTHALQRVINYIVNVIGADKDMGYYHCLCMTLRLLTSWHRIMRQPFSAAIKIWIYYDRNHTFNQKCVLCEQRIRIPSLFEITKST